MGWSHQLEHLSCLFKLDMRCLGFFPIKLFHNLGDIGRHASARPQPTLTHHFLYISIRESAPKEPEAFNALSWSNFLWWRALVDKKIGKQLLKGDAEFSARKHWRVGSCKFLRVNLATFFFGSFALIRRHQSRFFWSRLIKLSLEKKRGSLPGCSLSFLRDYILIMTTKIVIVDSVLMNIWGWFYHGDAKVWIWVKFFSQHDCACSKGNHLSCCDLNLLEVFYFRPPF